MFRSSARAQRQVHTAPTPVQRPRAETSQAFLRDAIGPPDKASGDGFLGTLSGADWATDEEVDVGGGWSTSTMELPATEIQTTEEGGFGRPSNLVIDDHLATGSRPLDLSQTRELCDALVSQQGTERYSEAQVLGLVDSVAQSLTGRDLGDPVQAEEYQAAVDGLSRLAEGMGMGAAKLGGLLLRSRDGAALVDDPNFENAAMQSIESGHGAALAGSVIRGQQSSLQRSLFPGMSFRDEARSTLAGIENRFRFGREVDGPEGAGEAAALYASTLTGRAMTHDLDPDGAVKHLGETGAGRAAIGEALREVGSGTRNWLGVLGDLSKGPVLVDSIATVAREAVDDRFNPRGRRGYSSLLKGMAEVLGGSPRADWLATSAGDAANALERDPKQMHAVLSEFSASLDQYEDPAFTAAFMTGLGTDIDALAAHSPLLQESLATLQAAGWVIEKGEADGGTYADRNAKKMVFDEATLGHTNYVVQSLAHEAGHALDENVSYPEFGDLSREEYIEHATFQRLRGEGEATILNLLVRDEILDSASGVDIQVSGKEDVVLPLWDAYKQGQLSRSELVDQIAEHFRGQAPSSKPDTNYWDHYSQQWATYWDNNH